MRGKIEADEASTGDAWYDEEEEEAMLSQEEERAGGAVADEKEARTNASSSTAPSSSAAASASASAGSDSASSASAWLVHASVLAMSKRQALVQSRPFSTPILGMLVGVLSQKKTHNTTTNQLIYCSI